MAYTYEAANIEPLNFSKADEARRLLDSLTKPQGSLGRLEQLAIKLAAITGQVPPPVAPAGIIIMAADHGVVDEGISAYPREVTVQMVHNFLASGGAINALAGLSGAKLRIVDVGVAGTIDHPDLIVSKIRPGTGNMCLEPAMTRAEAAAAIDVGYQLALAEADLGTRVMVLGEMGIGNTTASAAVLAALTGGSPAEFVGPGTGLDARGVAHKADVIRRALAFHRPDAADTLGVLAAVGGLEIAALAGLVIGAAQRRLPILMDGFITGAAAVAAAHLAPAAQHYLIAAHRSAEPGHDRVLALLDQQPLLDLSMRLGEGSGAALALPLLAAAHRIMTEMATFAEAKVSGPEEVKIIDRSPQ